MDQVTPEMIENFQKLREFLNIKGKVANNEDTEEQTEAPAEEDQLVGKITNLIENDQIMKNVGISFGEERTYFIQEALYKFVQKTGLNSFDFWGMINTK